MNDFPEFTAPAKCRPMPKVPRTALRTYMLRWLKEQGGLCPLCGKPIDHTVKGEGVVDHDHDTGEIRGILHRSCNAAEGKIANAAGRWGAGSMSYAAITPFLQRMVDYLQQPGKGFMYPSHKSDEEKRLDRNKKAREARAKASASGRTRRKAT